MEFVIFVMVGIAGLGAIGIWLAIEMARGGGRNLRERDELLVRKDQVLDEVFDGRPMVSYQSTIRTLPLPDVVDGAGVRGYVLASNTNMPNGDLIEGRDLVFTRRESGLASTA